MELAPSSRSVSDPRRRPRRPPDLGRRRAHAAPRRRPADARGSPRRRSATATTTRRSRPTTSTATSTTPTSASTSAGSAPSTARPGDPEGYLLPFEEIGRKIEETLALNGTGILMQGGVHPDLPLSYYEDLLRYLRENYPALHVHAFSPPEIKFIAKKERMSFYDVIGVLKAAGLMSIPGGGAEILSDRIRKDVLAYPKCSAEEWIDIMRQAHRHGLRTSATMMYGMGEAARGARRALPADPRPPGRDRRLHRLHLLDLPARAHRDAGRARDLRRRVPEDARRLAPLPRQHRPLPDQLGDAGQEDRPGRRSPSAPTTWARS